MGFKMNINKKQIQQIIGFSIIIACVVVVLFILGIILYDITSKGICRINWEFLTMPPRNGMTEGGIFPALIGTFFVTIITAIFSIPLGMGCAIYLNEYAKDTAITRVIRMAIRNLSGVPSIVYGLFGVILFVQLMHIGTCILASGATLALMTLPWTITASEEALKNVPQAYRDGALALGATKWQAIRTNVLPYAVPGMLTGTILGLARAAGETAPILFTGAAFFLPDIPKSIFDQFMALPYHLYIMATQHHDIEGVRPIAYGTALVLVAMIFIMNLTSIIIRYKLRKIKKD
ncbi:Phosphate transport system permease protein 2 [Candidatus Omnitrophus magneticus]|uniref:Phosphate transport system permease protein PstA n=1 Tax=Candidatus Omnitrophus magneticus TaxID=1609969 RepID=A0A0F0CM49_9BACT|nr:Phosphate transport system permease protein 2 [Candidatus Omnitrophus magneticus]